ncbi:MAG TPA: DUF1697 domain-containing protein [Candidatus Paceibacterota bacterium]|nr:DUF1697 domain-containing protein [Candidatus Paceibacterota bacterium]
MATTYVALIRGIGPTNPNMKGEKLKAAFESLGFKNVVPVIASGNIVFESASKSPSALETKIEQGLSKILGFSRATIVRSRADIERLIKKNPFKGVKDEKPNYLVVTFFKSGQEEACTVIDLSKGPTPEFMRDLEKKHGKDITTRTWKTVGRILKAMDSL